MDSPKQVLPQDFDGIFRFTNFTKEPFVAKWGGVEYTFPPEKTTPMIIATASPVEVQHIRKKFAKELAEREFYKSENIKRLDAMNPQHTIGSMSGAVTYNPDDLAPYIQRCLEPLPEARATTEFLPTANADTFLRKNQKGKTVTKVLDGDESLVGDGTVIA